MSCIKGIGCSVSSQVVVSFTTCHKLALGTSRNETTACVRNPQPIPWQAEQTLLHYFDRFTT